MLRDCGESIANCATDSEKEASLEEVMDPSMELNHINMIVKSCCIQLR